MKSIFTNQLIKLSLALFVIVLATLSGGLLQAQNIAPLATTNTQGSGPTNPNTPYQWNMINDLNYGTCGAQQAFVWTTDPPNGTEWLEWSWAQSYAINKLVIEHAETGGRFLTGATIQIWNGSAWVNHYSFSGLPQVCSNTVNFPIAITSKMRLTNFIPGTGQRSNLNYREIEIWQGAFPGTHGRVTDTYNKDRNCGTTTDGISVDVQNIGTLPISNFWVGSRVTGTVNGNPVTLNDSVFYTGTLNTAQTATINLFSFNSNNGGSLNVKSWVRVTNDANQLDDTLANTVKILGSPTANPSPTDNSICGSGSVQLSGGPAAGHSVVWYDAAVGGNMVGLGNSYKTPPIPAPITRTYYAASAKISGDSILTTGFAGTSFAGNGFMGGNMFTVKVTKPVAIDSLKVHLNLTNDQTVSFYMKTGEYSGFQTVPAAWSLVERRQVKARGFGVQTGFPLSKPLKLMPGTYSFYIYATDQLIFQTQATPVTIKSTAFETMHGIALRDSFATFLVHSGTLPHFSFNGSFHYHEFCESSTRFPVNATAKPLATGSQFAKGTGFTGIFDAGTLTQPDIVAVPDQLVYDILAPTGFANASYGSSGTWYIANMTAKVYTSGGNIPGSDISLAGANASNNAKITFKPSSTYTDSVVEIKITIRRNDNGCDTSFSRFIFIAPRPKAGFNATVACQGEVVEFTNTSTISSGQVTYFWDFKDGKTSDLGEPSHIFSTGGVFNVTLIAKSNYGYLDSIIVPVTVNRLPVPSFDFDNACEGTSVKLTDISTLPPGTASFDWDYGDGSAHGSGATSQRMYAQPGIYPVTLVVTVNGCTDRVTKYVTQAPRGVPSFTLTTGDCDNADVTFTNTSSDPEFGAVSYMWKFGDGSEGTGTTNTHTYNVFGAYNAKLIASTELGCIDSVSKPVTLRESPKAAFNHAAVTCTNEAISFTNNTNVPAGSTNIYEWDFGNADKSTDANPVYTYASPGTYKVKLKASSTNLCSGETEVTITIEEKPTADFHANKVCQGTATNFVNNSTISAGALTYNWDLGNSTSSSLANPSLTYTTAGTYNVVLVAETSTGCKDTSKQSVVVAAIPAVNILPASNNSGDGTIKFATATTGVTYVWNFGDGGSSNLQNPSYKYGFPGLWTVRLTVTSPDGCVNTTTTQVNVNPLSTGEIDAAKGMMVYPNPGTGIYNLVYTGASAIQTLVVTDMLGRHVADISTENNANGEVRIDISGQNAGVYFVTLTDSEGKVLTQKITLTK